MTLQEILFALLRVEVCKGELPVGLQENLTLENIQKLYTISKAQDLAHLVGDALLRYNLLPQQNKELHHKFITQRRMAVYRREQLDYELKNISAYFEEAKIEHLPLKGSVLKSYYPENWMRTSCDIDVLVHKADVDACIEKLRANDYKLEGDHYHDMSLYSANNVHLELHYELIEERDSLPCHAMLENLWENLLDVEGRRYEKRMKEEWFFFYHIAHMAKHFVYGGCGIRPFLDLWVMERKIPYDKNKLQEMLQQGGLLSFYEYAHKLSEYWFSCAEEDDTVQEMQEYVLRGGVYGTMENKVSVNREKPKSKIAYIFSSLFLSYKNLCVIYPSLKGRKWLTPVYQVRRWFRIIFKGTSKNTQETLRAYDAVSEDQRQRVQALLEKLAL